MSMSVFIGNLFSRKSEKVLKGEEVVKEICLVLSNEDTDRIRYYYDPTGRSQGVVSNLYLSRQDAEEEIKRAYGGDRSYYLLTLTDVLSKTVKVEGSLA